MTLATTCKLAIRQHQHGGCHGEEGKEGEKSEKGEEARQEEIDGLSYRQQRPR
jgi:hypothetical protein